MANYLKISTLKLALVLSKLSSNHSTKVIGSFSKKFAFEVIKLMLSMDSVKKEVLEKVEKTLRTEFISNMART